jgi:hypothetical protein
MQKAELWRRSDSGAGSGSSPERQRVSIGNQKCRLIGSEKCRSEGSVRRCRRRRSAVFGRCNGQTNRPPASSQSSSAPTTASDFSTHICRAAPSAIGRSTCSTTTRQPQSCRRCMPWRLPSSRTWSSSSGGHSHHSGRAEWANTMTQLADRNDSQRTRIILTGTGAPQ